MDSKSLTLKRGSKVEELRESKEQLAWQREGKDLQEMMREEQGYLATYAELRNRHNTSSRGHSGKDHLR